MKKILSAKNISKTFKSEKVLNNIDFDIYSGEIVSIIGPSGAGKTTLIEILSTILKPDEEEKFSLKIAGKEIQNLSDNEICKIRNDSIGFIFQSHELLPEFSAIENVMLPGLIKGLPKNICLQKAKDLLTELDLIKKINSSPTELSGGEQQRVSVARALINQPKIIFADEPTGNLDSKNAELLHKIFLNLRKKYNQTFIIVTHNVKLASMSDRVLNLKDGMLIN